MAYVKAWHNHDKKGKANEWCLFGPDEVTSFHEYGWRTVTLTIAKRDNNGRLYRRRVEGKDLAIYKFVCTSDADMVTLSHAVKVLNHSENEKPHMPVWLTGQPIPANNQRFVAWITRKLEGFEITKRNRSTD